MKKKILFIVILSSLILLYVLPIFSYYDTYISYFDIMVEQFKIFFSMLENFNIKKLELYAIQILICIILLSPFILEIILIVLLIIKKEKGVIILSIVNVISLLANLYFSRMWQNYLAISLSIILVIFSVLLLNKKKVSIN